MPLPAFALPALAYGGSALLGGLGSAAGKSGKWKQLPTVTPQQAGLIGQAGQMGLQQLQNPYAGFEPIAQRAQSMFQQQTVPALAERFTALKGGALSSPAFASQLGQAGSGLSEALAALMAQYGQTQQGLGQSLLGLGLSPQFENTYTPGGHTFLSSLLGGAGEGLGALGGYGLQRNMFKTQIGAQQSNLERILAALKGGQ